MKINKPKFWDKNNHTFFFYNFITNYLLSNNYFIKKNYLKKKKFSIPIICVGNIYIGGTGKTPLSIKICKELKIKNLQSSNN